MNPDRRDFLKCVLGTGAAGAVGLPAGAQAAPRREAPPDAAGMLYDATRCIGCKACVTACKDANGMQPETDRMGARWDAPTDLSCDTKNIIKLYKGEGVELDSFMKAQCMHCVDPACVAACMIGALKKRELGIVTWDADRCIGCRNCQVVCPFNVPKFEWESTNPKIVKCEMCVHLIRDGGIPACCDVCPREAVIYGSREELLEEAHRRLAEHPDTYVDKVYGEHDAGGTQVLYLSAVPFEKLGLPDLGDEAVPEHHRAIQHGIYTGFIAPVALYGVLGAVMWRNRTMAREEGGHDA